MSPWGLEFYSGEILYGGRNRIFNCEADGQIVEVLHGSKGEVSCCVSPMKPL
jgi:desulfoferrodoxin-like iron-binding protein